MIIVTRNERKLEWRGSVVLQPRRGGSRRRGDLRWGRWRHAAKPTGEGWLWWVQSGLGEVADMAVRWIWKWWTVEDELELELSSAVMELGGWKRTEGMHWCLREGRRGRWILQDGQILLPKAAVRCCVASSARAVVTERWAARRRWRAAAADPWNRELKHETCFHVSIEIVA